MIAPTQFSNKQLCLLEEETLHPDIMQSVITLVTIFLHDATEILFPPEQKDNCIFLYSSQIQAVAKIKQTAESSLDLFFKAFFASY